MFRRPIAALLLLPAMAWLSAVDTPAQSTPAVDIVVHAGRLIDGVGAAIRGNSTILAATRHAADLLGASDRIGSVQPGRYADLVAGAGNPLTDIAQLRRITWVMKGGAVVRGNQ